MNESNRNKKYLYNVNFANSAIQYGIKCIETGFNPKRQSFFWVFDYYEIQDFYEAIGKQKARGSIDVYEKTNNSLSKSTNCYDKKSPM